MGRIHALTSPSEAMRYIEDIKSKQKEGACALCGILVDRSKTVSGWEKLHGLSVCDQCAEDYARLSPRGLYKITQRVMGA